MWLCVNNRAISICFQKAFLLKLRKAFPPHPEQELLSPSGTKKHPEARLWGHIGLILHFSLALLSYALANSCVLQESPGDLELPSHECQD